MLLRDLCLYFPESVHDPLQEYVPFLARLANMMNSSSRIVEVWCIIEALFFIYLKWKIWYLEYQDPLEASLSAAPMLDSTDRKKLWTRMMEVEQKDDIVAFLTGWFFDEAITNISRYDVNDFVCWSMFDGRNQEHLTLMEVSELEEFVDELEIRISLHLYGPAEEDQGQTSIHPSSNRHLDTSDDMDDIHKKYAKSMTWKADHVFDKEPHKEKENCAYKEHSHGAHDSGVKIDSKEKSSLKALSLNLNNNLGNKLEDGNEQGAVASTFLSETLQTPLACSLPRPNKSKIF